MTAGGARLSYRDKRVKRDHSVGASTSGPTSFSAGLHARPLASAATMKMRVFIFVLNPVSEPDVRASLARASIRHG